MVPFRRLFQRFFGSLTWRIPAAGNILYLTFDDGPVPEVTPWVLDILDAYGAKATFFCVGDNVVRHPEIFRSILDRGHAVGNHTFRHLNGWKTRTPDYLADTEACAAVVRSRLFRPPYGRIRRSQARRLSENYRIILWDVLSRDYDPSKTGGDCRDRVIRRARPGSIVVFHDSVKARERLQGSLPEVLEHFHRRGFRFHALAAEPGAA